MTYRAKIRRRCGPETCPTIDRVQGRIVAALAVLGRIDALANPDTCGVDPREAIREAVAEAVAAIEGEPAELERVRDTAGAMRDELADAWREIDRLDGEVDANARVANRHQEAREAAEAEAKELRDRIADLEALA